MERDPLLPLYDRAGTRDGYLAAEAHMAALGKVSEAEELASRDQRHQPLLPPNAPDESSPDIDG
eukprot:524378-Hanusia_phi.AAC.12